MIDTLLITHADGVTVITFNRPDYHNALDLSTMRRFAAAVDKLASDSQLRALILTGAGTKAFCSGGDLTQLSTMPSAEEAQTMISLMGDALLKMERLPVPVIAAINGYALGGGGEVALACDLRVVDSKARIGFVQGKMGLIPGWGGGQRLLRLVGYSRALDFLLRAHTLYAEDLHALGIANRIVEEGTALDGALELARHIAAQSPDVVRATKSLLQSGLHRPYDGALNHERELFPPLWAADPHLQAVAAFLNKTL